MNELSNNSANGPPEIDLSNLYDLYAPAFYGQIMKSCENKKEIGSHLLVATFKHAKENILSFNPDSGTKFEWIFKIFVCVLKDNGYHLKLNYKAGKIISLAFTEDTP